MNIQKHIFQLIYFTGYPIANQYVQIKTPPSTDYIANNLPCFATSEKESGFSYFLGHCKTFTRLSLEISVVFKVPIMRQRRIGGQACARRNTIHHDIISNKFSCEFHLSSYERPTWPRHKGRKVFGSQR